MKRKNRGARGRSPRNWYQEFSDRSYWCWYQFALVRKGKKEKKRGRATPLPLHSKIYDNCLLSCILLLFYQESRVEQ